jgi:AcrR family transcriptional regulator
MERQRTTTTTPATAASGVAAADGRVRSLWFDPPRDDQDRRRQLTRDRVVQEALAVIAKDGAEALTMRGLAARLGVVPGAVYRHVRNKQQLQDLVLDGVLAEVDVHLDRSLAWASSSSCSPIGCVRCSRPTPGWPGSSRPATHSALTPWPWPRRSLAPSKPPGSATARPGWPCSC